jgi:hypothetical protein
MYPTVASKVTEMMLKADTKVSSSVFGPKAQAGRIASLVERWSRQAADLDHESRESLTGSCNEILRIIDSAKSETGSP